MLTIIEKQGNADGWHNMQSQSHRTSCWMDGWIEVPPQLVSAVLASGGYCDLNLGEDGSLIGITPTERQETEQTMEDILSGEKKEENT